MSTIIFFIILFLFFIFNLGTDYFSHKWWFFIQGAITLLSYHVYLSSGLCLSLLVFYMMTSSAYYSVNIIGKHPVRAKNNPPFDNVMMRSLIASMCFCIVFILITKEVVDGFIMVMPFVLLTSIAHIFLPRKWRYGTSHKKKHVLLWGFGGNASVSSTFHSLAGIACLFLYDKFPIEMTIFSVLNLAAIIKTKCSAGLGGYTLGLLYFYGIHLEYYWIFAMLIPVIGIVGWLNGFKHMLSLSGRDWIVKFMWQNLRRFQPNRFTGCGIGSFLNMGHTMQIAKKDLFGGGVFLWLHCDAVQAIIEGGYIMGALVLAAIVESNLGLNPVVVAYTLCWGVNSLANFNNHMAADQFINLLVLKIAYS